MSEKQPMQEKCPNCGQAHVVPTEGKNYQEGGKTVHAYKDIQCPCGLTLRLIVPLFKVSESGYQLRAKLPREQDRN